MTAITNALAPYSKAIVCAVVIVVALALQQHGVVDLGIDVDGVRQQIGAVVIPTLLVYLVPNTARLGKE